MKYRILLIALNLCMPAHAMHNQPASAKPGLNELGKCVECLMQEPNRKGFLKWFTQGLLLKLESSSPCKVSSQELDRAIQTKDIQYILRHLEAMRYSKPKLACIKKVLNHWEAEMLDAAHELDESRKSDPIDIHLRAPESKLLVQIVFSQVKECNSFLNRSPMVSYKSVYRDLKHILSKSSDVDTMFRDAKQGCLLMDVRNYLPELGDIQSTAFIRKVGDLFVQRVSPQVHPLTCRCKGKSLLHQLAKTNGKILKYVIDKLKEKSYPLDLNARVSQGQPTLFEYAEKYHKGDSMRVLAKAGADYQITSLDDHVEAIPGFSGHEIQRIYYMCRSYPDELLELCVEQVIEELFPEIEVES